MLIFTTIICIIGIILLIGGLTILFAPFIKGGR
jgi:hypothetical protein